ncbi:hypothetical protein AAP_03940 [Ascosphaera apis ARSEF 7405]|uniref:Uncharacterized protein n=1 Tax=Ascosphaera apis ARSEF 7405 TaxID=392613 RepID=A0A166NJF6_9EURO|nr:hypothetical protein AAP_03940 [Ascosphaera apis ARSEF 7405]
MAQKSLNSGEGSTSGKRREKVERLTKMMEDVDDNDNEQKKGESGLEKGVEGMRIS